MWFCSESNDDSDSEYDKVRFGGSLPPLPVYQLLDAAVAEQKVAFVPKFLAAKDISRIHHMAQRDDVKTIDDRDESLVYRHEVWRCMSCKRVPV